MKDHEVEWLCKHMGHTVSIHKLHYKAMSGYIERINIGKLMMMQDLNVAGTFVGRDLNEVNVEGEY